MIRSLFFMVLFSLLAGCASRAIVKDNKDITDASRAEAKEHLALAMRFSVVAHKLAVSGRDNCKYRMPIIPFSVFYNPETEGFSESIRSAFFEIGGFDGYPRVLTSFTSHIKPGDRIDSIDGKDVGSDPQGAFFQRKIVVGAFEDKRYEIKVNGEVVKQDGEMCIYAIWYRPDSKFKQWPVQSLHEMSVIQVPGNIWLKHQLTYDELAFFAAVNISSWAVGNMDSIKTTGKVGAVFGIIPLLRILAIPVFTSVAKVQYASMESDMYLSAIKIMKSAGYDPQAGVSYMKKFQKNAAEDISKYEKVLADNLN